MLLGRKELSAILLAIGAILFYLVLLSATPSRAQTGGGTTDNLFTIQEDVTIEEEIDEEADVVARAESRPRRERTIINIPRKPLPPSGGLPVYLTVAGFVLTGGGLLTLGFMIRRGSRR